MDIHAEAVPDVADAFAPAHVEEVNDEQVVAFFGDFVLLARFGVCVGGAVEAGVEGVEAGVGFRLGHEADGPDGEEADDHGDAEVIRLPVEQFSKFGIGEPEEDAAGGE